MKWYFEVLKKYAVFHGRARRKEYWMFVLFNILIYIVLRLLQPIVSAVPQPVLADLYAIAVFLPALAVTVRRLHDTGRSGWWVLVGLVPLIGDIVLLVFMVHDGQPGENRYGANPKSTVMAY